MGGNAFTNNKVLLSAKRLREIKQAILEDLTDTNPVPDVLGIATLGSTRIVNEQEDVDKEIEVNDIDFALLFNMNVEETFVYNTEEEIITLFEKCLKDEEILYKKFFKRIFSIPYNLNQEEFVRIGEVYEEDKIVQMDIVIARNNEHYLYLQNILFYSNETEEGIKGAHRTELLRSLMKNYGYSLSTDGLKRYKLNKDRTIKDALVFFEDKKKKARTQKQQWIDAINYVKQFKNIKYLLKSLSYSKSEWLASRYVFRGRIIPEQVYEYFYERVEVENWTYDIVDALWIRNLTEISTFKDIIKIMSNTKLTKKELFYILSDFQQTIEKSGRIPWSEYQIDYLCSNLGYKNEYEILRPLEYSMYNNIVTDMPSIPHLYTLPYEQIVDVLNDFIMNRMKWEVTEKVDGENFSFGYIYGKGFYTKTRKGARVFNPSDYNKFSFENYFKKAHDYLVEYKVEELLKDAAIKYRDVYKLNKIPSIQVFTEYLGTKKPNTIKYNRIDDMFFYIYDVKVDGEIKFDDPSIIELYDNLFICINTEEGNIRRCCLSIVITDEKRTWNPLLFEDLVVMYGAGFKYNKSGWEKQREECDRIVENICNSIYNDFSKEVDLRLGNEKAEGFVFRNTETGFLFKVVDNVFKEENRENWKERDALREICSQSKQRLIKEVFFNSDILKDKGKLLQKIGYAITEEKCIYSYLLMDIMNEARKENGYPNTNEMKSIYINILEERIKQIKELVKEETEKERGGIQIENMLNYSNEEYNRIRNTELYVDLVRTFIKYHYPNLTEEISKCNSTTL